MRTDKRIWSAALVVVAALAATPACAAQAYGRSQYGYGYGYNGNDRRAADDGYRHGLDDGRSDARKNRSFSPERHGEYRDAQRDYNRGDWERQARGRSFARGYEAGYREGFNQFARNYDWRR
jgi:hypothetical protein